MFLGMIERDEFGAIRNIPTGQSSSGFNRVETEVLEEYFENEVNATDVVSFIDV
jgi:hypothetical protein